MTWLRFVVRNCIFVVIVLMFGCGNERSIRTDLHEAAVDGDVTRVKELLEAGAEVNAKDELGITPLYEAVTFNKVDVARSLVEYGAKVNSKDKWGNTPLMSALYNGACEAAEFLVNKGASLDPQYQNDEGFLLLHAASHGGCCNFVSSLIDKGADVNTQTVAGATPLYMASQKGYKNVCELLFSAGADVNLKGVVGAPLHAAARSGNYETVKFLFNKGAKVNVRDDRWRTPLCEAVSSNKPSKDIVWFLVENGAKVEVKDKSGNSPLLSSLSNGACEIAEFLLQKGATLDPEYHNEDGFTLIHAASRGGCYNFVSALIDKGADVNSQTTELQITPLFLASEYGHEKVVHVLLEHGAVKNLKGFAGEDASVPR